MLKSGAGPRGWAGGSLAVLMPVETNRLGSKCLLLGTIKGCIHQR